MRRRILLPLERSDDAAAAVTMIRSLGHRRHVEILLLRIEEWPIVGPFGLGWAPSWRAGDLDDVKAGLEEDGEIQTKILSPEAAPSSVVVDQARRRAASLIVLPYRCERTWLRRVQGHPADRVLRDSPVPVLAVPEGGSRSAAAISRILYLYESDEAAIPGLRHVIDFAQLFEASVFLLRTETPAAAEERFLPSFLFRREEHEREAEGLPSLEERLISILRRREVPAQVLAGSDDPSRDVPTAISRNAIDLVILSKTRDTDKARTALARHLLQSSPASVLLTREGSYPSPWIPANSPLRVGI